MLLQKKFAHNALDGHGRDRFLLEKVSYDIAAIGLDCAIQKSKVFAMNELKLD